MQVDKNNAMELNTNNKSKEYKIKTIYNKAIQKKKLKLSHLSGLYYLVL